MCDGSTTDGAVGAVSERVVALLADRVAGRTGADPDAVALGSPADLTADPEVRLGVYLYRIERSGRDGNYRRSAEQANGGRTSVVRKDPPLTLDLGYLLTAYPSSRDVLAQHRLLGAAMGALHDTPVLGVPEAPGETPVRITLESSPPDERAWLWETFPATPHRLSVGYHVSPVVIESRTESDVERVTERRASVSRTE